MAKVALILTIILYSAIFIDNLRGRDYPHALIWFAYTVSNIGFLWYEFTKT